MKRPLPRIWLITDRKQMQRDLVDAVQAALGVVPPGSVGVILREKDLDGGPLLMLAQSLRAACGSAPLVINGRLDVALASSADGVHLGGDAPSPSDIRRFAPDLLIGTSLHRSESIAPEADYALLSPIFETTSKPGASPLGVTELRLRAWDTKTPLYALGGIDAGNAGTCLQAGAAGVAVRGHVLMAPDPAEAVRELARAIGISTS